ncbi:MAG TPA: hypothetical protein ENK57_03280 [Polyangiaceae bacterium]|nr:hypothetical protein [Polyangiaceae bacterium]
MPTSNGRFVGSDFCTGSVGTRPLADEAVTSIKLAKTLQSDNFVAGSSGWQIKRDTGDAEFNNITIRGDLISSNWDGGLDLSGGKDTSATAGFFLDSSAGAAQFQQIYAEGGELNNLDVTGILTLTSSGKLRTAASGARAELVGSGTTSGTFYYVGFSGETDEHAPVIWGAQGYNGPEKVPVLSLISGRHPSGALGDEARIALFAGTATRPRLIEINAEHVTMFGDTLRLPDEVTFTGDLATGIFRPAAANVAIKTGGVERFRVDQGGGVKVYNEIQLGDGSVADPPYTFLSDGNTGIYRPGADQLGFACGGVLRAAVTTSELQVRGDKGVHLYDYAPSTTGAGANATWTHVGGGVYRLDRSTSSRRYKARISDALDLAAVPLRPRRWWSRLDERHQVGFVAEEIADVLPEAVEHGPDGPEHYDPRAVLAVLAAKIGRIEATLGLA